VKLGVILGFLVVGSLGAEPLTLINTLPDRPVFNLVSAGVTQTRALAPGARAYFEAGVFSGLGEKNVPLVAHSTYYLARVGALPGLYHLTPDQVLILNQSGRAVAITLAGKPAASAVLATGNWALGDLNHGPLPVSWDDGTGTVRSTSLTDGGVYRLVLDSPEGGLGTLVNLTVWKAAD